MGLADHWTCSSSSRRNRQQGQTTGEVEFLGKEVKVLNQADTPPFQLDAHAVGEEIRLKNRFDLRRPDMLNNPVAPRVSASIRRLDDNGFDVDADFTRATEGARLPGTSRTHQGQFCLAAVASVAQATAMVSGVDKYYQIAKCFRDEDLRADRQPEFT